MGEPIKLPDGRIVYGRAQAAVMAAEAGQPKRVTATITHSVRPEFPIDLDDYREEIASEPVVQPVQAPAESVSFQAVRGIGPSTELALYNAGILTWEDVLQTGVIEIVALGIDGLGMVRARALFDMARREAK